MQDLRVIGVEEGKLVAISDDGERYLIAVDEGLRSAFRSSGSEPRVQTRVSPREIQSKIRAGLSAEEVASATGISIEDVKRFEGPVLAEREFVITTAKSVAVNTVLGAELGEQPGTFGAAIQFRLHQLGAREERWASWKEEQGQWVIKLTFSISEIEHDARWRFDPRKQALSPLNSDAENLSRQGDLSGSLIPRLRAVDGSDSAPDESRFDSGAFSEADLKSTSSTQVDSRNMDTAPQLEKVPYGRIGSTSQKPNEKPQKPNQTADLLEALRKRRGEREVASFEDLDEVPFEESTRPGIRLVEGPLDEVDFEEEPVLETEPDIQSPPKSARRNRASVPSWDEIVFGARSDDDPA